MEPKGCLEEMVLVEVSLEEVVTLVPMDGGQWLTRATSPTSVTNVDEDTDIHAHSLTTKSPTRLVFSAAWCAKNVTTTCWHSRITKGPTLT